MQSHPFSSAASLSPFAALVCDIHSKVIVVSPNNSLQLNESLLFESPRRSPRRFKIFNNYYTSDFLLPNPSAVCAHAVAANLSASQHAPTQILLSPMQDDSTTARYLIALNQRGWRCQKFNATGNWYLPCEKLSYEAYLELLRLRGGNPVRRKAKAFFKNTRNRVEIVTNLDARPDVEQIYHAVYKKSWHFRESHPEYVSAWMRACSARGWLRLGIAWVDEQPVAVQFWFKIGSKAFIYKMAYDEAYSDLSAGTVLTGQMFRHALDVDRVSEVDYLTGDDAYKQTWVTHRRQLIGLEAFNLRTALGLAQWLIHRLVGATKSIEAVRALKPYFPGRTIEKA